MKIRSPLNSQLWAFFGALCLLVVAGAALNIVGIEAERRFVERDINAYVHIEQQAERMRQSSSNMLRVAFQASLERNEELLYEAGARAAEFFDQHQLLGRQLSELPAGATSRAQMLAHHERLATSFRHVASATLAMLADTVSEGVEVPEASLSRVRLMTNALNDEMSRFVALAQADLDAMIDESRHRAELNRLRQYVTIAIAVAALAAFLIFLVFHIARPFARLAAFVRKAELAPLSISERYAATRRDEIGELGERVNELLDQLQRAGVSRDFVDRIFDATQLALMVVDNLGVVRRENPATRQLAGRSLCGEPIDTLLEHAGNHGEGKLHCASGEARPVLVSMAQIFDVSVGGSGLVIGLADLTQLKEAEAKLLRRERLLQAVGETSSLLLARHGDSGAIVAAIGLIGAAIGADRVNVVECLRNDRGEERVTLRHEWCSPGTPSYLGSPLVSDVDWQARMPVWQKILSAGQTLTRITADTSGAEREFLESRGVVSLIAVPVFVEHSLWGFIGFNDCHAPRPWSEGEAEALRTIGADIGQLIVQQRALSQLRLSARVFEESGEAIAVTDARGNFVSVNRAFTDVTGYAAEEVIGRNPRLLQSGRHDAGFYAQMWKQMGETGSWQGEIWNRRKSGELYPEWLNISSVRTPEGEITHYVAIFSDITERKAAQARIEYLAHHDPLTGLPNRSLLRERLEHEISRARRNEKQLGVLFLDLDRFKTINDSLGHAAGDRLLREVADRLRHNLRETDVVCRQGGDEFIVILPELADATAAAQAANKIIEALREPVDVGDRSVHTSFSIGIALFPEDGHTPSSLLKAADMAMYHAKESERGTFRFFTHELNARAVERLELDSKLRQALYRHEFEVHYQPQWSLADRRLTGVEALVRWRSDGEWIAPSRFIPVAEDNGQIVALGHWVLNEACRAAAAWRAQGHPVTVAVNVSPVQIRRDDMVKRVSTALAISGLPADALELEITESLLMDDDSHALEALAALKQLGIKLAIDDFGTGYSNLAYLKRFAVDRLKIDQSFVRGIDNRPDTAAIVGAVIEMGRRLGLNTIAEGVETETEYEALLRAGCNEVQGYLLGRPMSGEALTELLSAESEASRPASALQ